MQTTLAAMLAYAEQVRADDAIRGKVATRIEPPVFIGPLDGLVQKRPDEAPRAHLAGAHGFPEIIEPRARAAVVEAVEELGGHVNRCAGA